MGNRDICEWCGKDFESEQGVWDGYRHYCSERCLNAAKKAKARSHGEPDSPNDGCLGIVWLLAIVIVLILYGLSQCTH